jgi:DNA-binding NarL/FixJ family response regulator
MVPPNLAAALAVPADCGMTGRRLRVAMADDDADVLVSLHELFTASGRWEVVAAVNDGIDLLRVLDVEAPELVLTDLHMPNGDEQLIERLGHHPSRPLIIALSAATSPSAARRLLELGADLVLRKGIDRVVVAAERLCDERGVTPRS